MPLRQIAKVMVKKPLSQPSSDFAYWQTRPYQERLAALEEICQEYHRWKNDVQSGFQRVYRITKYQSG